MALRSRIACPSKIAKLWSVQCFYRTGIDFWTLVHRRPTEHRTVLERLNLVETAPLTARPL
eukprot:1152642-Rhodomonas_salina.1